MEIKIFGHIKYSILLCCYQSQVSHTLVEIDTKNNFPGWGLPMVEFQEIGVYYRPQLGLPYRFVEFGHDYRCLCDVTLSVYPHREGLKSMPGHGGIRTYDLWNTSPMLCQLSYAVRSVRVCDISELSLVPSISV